MARRREVGPGLPRLVHLADPGDYAQPSETERGILSNFRQVGWRYDAVNLLIEQSSSKTRSKECESYLPAFRRNCSRHFQWILAVCLSAVCKKTQLLTKSLLFCSYRVCEPVAGLREEISHAQ